MEQDSLPAEEWRAQRVWGEGEEGRPQEGQRGPPTPDGSFRAHREGGVVLHGLCPFLRDSFHSHTVLTALITPKSEVRGVTCCAKDLCDGVAPTGRSLWALAAGLLLSLGPTFLWVLL